MIEYPDAVLPAPLHHVPVLQNLESQLRHGLSLLSLNILISASQNAQLHIVYPLLCSPFHVHRRRAVESAIKITTLLLNDKLLLKLLQTAF